MFVVMARSGSATGVVPSEHPLICGVGQVRGDQPLGEDSHGIQLVHSHQPNFGHPRTWQNRRRPTVNTGLRAEQFPRWRRRIHRRVVGDDGGARRPGGGVRSGDESGRVRPFARER